MKIRAPRRADGVAEGAKVQGQFWGVGIIATLIVILANIGEYRRRRRRNLENVGILPLQAIMVIATFIALFAFAFGLKEIL